jgi:hypothetical protein
MIRIEVEKYDIDLSTYDQMKKFVNQMDMEILYKLPTNLKWESMVIEYDGGYGYSWYIKNNYNRSGQTRHIYSSAGNNNVKFFKTLNGCKRNLIKRFELYYQ